MIAIWIRSTLDWSNEAEFRARLAPRFAPKVALWDRTFTIPYHRFRAAVRAIAADNLAAVADAVVTTRLEDLADGTLVLPVDDDDWFAPDVVAVLRAAGAAPGYRWTSTFLEQPMDLRHRVDLFRRRLLPGIPPRWSCTTNNYALVKEREMALCLRSHVHASAWADGAGRDVMIVLPRRLSVMNRTLAAQTTLGEITAAPLTPRRLRRKYARYRAAYRHLALPAELDWCRPYVARMDALMNELRLRAG